MAGAAWSTSCALIYLIYCSLPPSESKRASHLSAFAYPSHHALQAGTAERLCHSAPVTQLPWRALLLHLLQAHGHLASSSDLHHQSPNQTTCVAVLFSVVHGHYLYLYSEVAAPPLRLAHCPSSTIPTGQDSSSLRRQPQGGRSPLAAESRSYS